MALCGGGAGTGCRFFSPRSWITPTYGANLNWYPPADPARPNPRPGQYRIGTHTDFGTVTVLDREPGLGGACRFTPRRNGVKRAYDPAALTVNIGDLLARWTGDRWRSTATRVLPPAPGRARRGPALADLLLRGQPRRDRRVAGRAHSAAPLSPPVIAHEYLREKLDANHRLRNPGPFEPQRRRPAVR